MVFRGRNLKSIVACFGAFAAVSHAPAGANQASSDSSQAKATVEWPAYGGNKANSRYSPLDQITAENVKNLTIAWRWKSPDEDIKYKKKKVATWLNESTPIMVG